MRKILMMVFMTVWMTAVGQTHISTKEELMALDMDGSYVLDANIDLGGDELWVPLGNNPTSESDEGSFNGSLDGGGHCIKNLRVKVTDAATTYIGLFGRIGSSGIVKNLTLERAELMVASTEEHTRNIGSIAGVNHGMIADCKSDATVKCYAPSTDGGGIAGENQGTVMNGVFTGQVLTSQNGYGEDVYGNVMLGGIVGDNERGGVIMKCESTGVVTHADCDLYGQNNGMVMRENGEGVKMEGYRLYRDGSWNTLCLPFDVTIASSVLDGATVMELDLDTGVPADGVTHISGIEGSTLYLNFRAVRVITAGKPYLIKWTESAEDLVSPTFSGVTVTTTTPTGISSKDGNFTFTGTFSTLRTDAQGDNTLLYLGDGNTLYYPSESMSIGALRAYFRLNNGYVAGEPEGSDESEGGMAAPRRGIDGFRLNFGDEVSALEGIGVDERADGDVYYDLGGRRVSARHLSPGIYIKGGKCIFIRK